MAMALVTITVAIPSGWRASCPTTEDSWLTVVDNLAASPDISDPPARSLRCSRRTPCPALATEAPDQLGNVMMPLDSFSATAGRS